MIKILRDHQYGLSLILLSVFLSFCSSGYSGKDHNFKKKHREIFNHYSKGEYQLIWPLAADIYTQLDLYEPARPDSAFIRFLNDLGIAFLLQGEYSKTERLLLRCKSLLNKSANQRLYAETLKNLGLVMSKQNKFDPAALLIEEALAIAPKLGKNKSAMEAGCYQVLGEIRMQQNILTEANSNLTKALRIRRHEKDIDRGQLAQTLDSLGQLKLKEHQTMEALEYMQDAFFIRRGIYGSNHPHTALSLESLADLEKSRQNNEDALKKYQQAVQIYEDHYGSSHFRIVQIKDKISTLNN